MLEQSLAMPALCSNLMSVAQQLKLTANLIGLYFYIQMCLLEVELWCKIGHFKRSRWIGLLVKLLLDKYEMASAPTQKHLSGLSEMGAHLVTTEAYILNCTLHLSLKIYLRGILVLLLCSAVETYEASKRWQVYLLFFASRSKARHKFTTTDIRSVVNRKS